MFGDSAIPIASFTNNPQDVDKFKKTVDKLSRASGIPDLKKALEEAKKMFSAGSGRPKAVKVLVVLTDEKSSTTRDEIGTSAKPLEDDGIEVIPVAVGSEANPKQLEKMTPHLQNLLLVDKDEEPDEIGEKISKKILQGNHLFVA